MTAKVIDSNEKELRNVIFVVNQIGQGRSNAVGTVTLTANTGSTVVDAINCAAGSNIFLFQRTAHAAAALATTYVGTVASSSFTITHANNAQTDRNFFWLAIG